MSQRPNVHIASGIVPLNNQQAEESNENPTEINRTNGMVINASGENYQEKEDENSENKFGETSKENKEIKGKKINVETSVIYWKMKMKKKKNHSKFIKKRLIQIVIVIKKDSTKKEKDQKHQLIQKWHMNQKGKKFLKVYQNWKQKCRN